MGFLDKVSTLMFRAMTGTLSKGARNAAVLARKSMTPKGAIEFFKQNPTLAMTEVTKLSSGAKVFYTRAGGGAYSRSLDGVTKHVELPSGNSAQGYFEKARRIGHPDDARIATSKLIHGSEETVFNHSLYDRPQII